MSNARAVLCSSTACSYPQCQLNVAIVSGTDPFLVLDTVMGATPICSTYLPSALCYTFNYKKGNSYCKAEVLSILLLKCLIDAVCDSHSVHAVIHGCNSNHDSWFSRISKFLRLTSRRPPLTNITIIVIITKHGYYF
jgi:hypothetical protein